MSCCSSETRRLWSCDPNVVHRQVIVEVEVQSKRVGCISDWPIARVSIGNQDQQSDLPWPLVRLRISLNNGRRGGVVGESVESGLSKARRRPPADRGLRGSVLCNVNDGERGLMALVIAAVGGL